MFVNLRKIAGFVISFLYIINKVSNSWQRHFIGHHQSQLASQTYMDRFCNCLDCAAAEGKEIIVNGDFNCDYLPKKP